MRNRQDPLGNGLVRGRVPAETTSAIYHGRESGERAGGSAATQRGEASAGALVALRRDRARRSGLRAIGRHRSGVLVSGDRRTRRASRVNRDHELAIFRVDAGVSESALVQGIAGPHHRPGAHHRNWRRLVPFSQNPGGAAEKESIVAADGVASTLLVQRKGLKPDCYETLGGPQKQCEDALT